MDEIEINGKKYVLASKLNASKRETISNKKYVLARTENAGVFTGHLKSRNGKEIVLQDARRIWYWKGAASLSQLAMEGTKKPDECKFACPVDEVLLTELIEMIPIPKKAEENIKTVKEWKN